MIPAIGDFIAIAGLAGKAYQALSSGKGSKAEYRSLLATLKSLSQAMLQAEAMCMDFVTSSYDSLPKDKLRLERLEEAASLISTEREGCALAITDFLKENAAYTKAFAEEKVNVLKQGTRKLMWVANRPSAEVFERRINGHFQALQLHLLNFYQLTTKEEMADHKKVLDSVDSNMVVLTSGLNSMDIKMGEALQKFDTFLHTMPTAIGYAWGPEAPILLLDALGRKTPLPMMFAASPDTFRDILLIMHRDGPGYHKIENGRYIVSDEDASGALVRHEKWNESFKPGRRIGISFLLRYPGGDGACPRCQTIKILPADRPGQRRCLKCQLLYNVEDEARTRLFWRDLKPRPRLPPQLEQRRSSVGTKRRKESVDSGDKAVKRGGTLPQDYHPHPYARVHYQRKCRNTVEQQWDKANPEFKNFVQALPPLHRSAAMGDVDRIDELVEEGDDVNGGWSDPDPLYRHDRTGWDWIGAPPIHFAVYFGQKAAVSFLLSREGADIDAKDAAGTTALHAAAWTGNEKLLQMLLRKGADASICDYDGWNAAIYAMIQGHERIPQLLAGGSGDADGLVAESCMLRLAAKLGNADTVLRMLVRHQNTAQAPETTDFLLTEALVGAAEGGHVELLENLLAKGARADGPDQSGCTALHWAGWGGHAEIGNQMYDEDAHSHGSDEDDERADDEDGPASRPHELVVEMLVREGADINARNNQGCTPLHWVAGAGSAPMIRCFLGHGASVDEEDNTGRTPIDRARETKDEEILELLDA